MRIYTPPIDHLATVTGARMVGGHDGAIPDLFWLLRHRGGSSVEISQGAQTLA